MGLLDKLFSSLSNSSEPRRNNLIDYGQNKSDGSHDHRTNKGNDRTPSQQKGDKSRRKP